MAWPQDITLALDSLKEHGIGVIVSLTMERLDPDLLAEWGFELRHIPIRDFAPPTQDQIDEFVAIVDDARESGKAVMAHCYAGMGRTGTMLAAYLVSAGADPVDAIAAVREMRPGSIETPEQEAAVFVYWKRLLDAG